MFLGLGLLGLPGCGWLPDDCVSCKSKSRYMTNILKARGFAKKSR